MTREWTPDETMPSFQCTTLPLLAEDDGALVATVIRKRAEPASAASGNGVAFLYVHGFVDYFFHAHVADAIVASGMDFYAVELRRHGRSLREGNRGNYCTDVAQYFTEITAAIALAVDEDQHDAVVLYGHSTGALVVSLYAHEGERRASVSALVLNSPFFGFDVTLLQRLKLPIAVAIGRFLPWLSDPKAISPLYGESIHASKHGEWNYNLRWKPINGFPAYFGWVRAIKHGHDRVALGLNVRCPVLVLHSDRSGAATEWSESLHSRDIVLSVDQMRVASSKLGEHVERREIAGAIHDIMLSPEPVRTHALNAMLQWLPASSRSVS
jgi:alpha-beta hydrolase superfamily lysophospholipase